MPMPGYEHWNEDAEWVSYMENRYDTEPEWAEYEYFPDEQYIDPDECAAAYQHQQNTSGRTITFAGVEVYDQQVCDDCDIDLSVPWPNKHVMTLLP